VFNNCFNLLQSHDRKGVVTKIGKLINKFTCPEQRRRTNPPINCLHRARKNNKNMQNEPNLKQLYEFISAYTSSTYRIYVLESTPKNEPKRTQNEPNFSPKLALFFQILASFGNEIFAFANIFVTSVCSVVKNNLVQIRVKSWFKNQYQSAKSAIISYRPITAMPSWSPIFGICSLKFE